MQINSPVSAAMRAKAERLGIEVSPDATTGDVHLLINEFGGKQIRRPAHKQVLLARRLGLRSYTDHPYVDDDYLECLIHDTLKAVTQAALDANPNVRGGATIELGNQTYRVGKIGNNWRSYWHTRLKPLAGGDDVVLPTFEVVELYKRQH